MQWDNSPVYRRRRRAVLAALVVAVLLLGWAARAVVGALRGADEPSVAVPAATSRTPVAPTLPSSPASRNWSGRAPEITLAFAGDVQAHRDAGRINSVGLGATGEVLARADLAMVNLETVVAEDTSGLVPQPKQYTFVTTPEILDSLHAAGVDVLAAANNHTMDYGPEGMRRMLQVRERSPLPLVGLGRDDAEAWAPWRTEVKGRTVVVFSATDVLEDNLDWKAGPGKPGLAKVRDHEGFARLLAGVREARAAGQDDVVVVYLHSGIELNRCPTVRQQYTARRLAEAGADVVLGSHAHILQPTATIGSTAVAHGLGNFVFPAASARTTATGVLTVTVPPAGTPRMDFSPATIRKGLPQLAEGTDAQRAARAFAGLGQGCTAASAAELAALDPPAGAVAQQPVPPAPPATKDEPHLLVRLVVPLLALLALAVVLRGRAVPRRRN